MRMHLLNKFNFCRRTVLLAVVCSSAIVAAAQERKAKTDEAAEKYASEVRAARRAIEAANAQWVEGWRRGDAAMVAAIFTANGLQLQSSGKIIAGRGTIMKSQQKAMQSVESGVEVKVETAAVWIVDGDAYESGKWTYKYIEKGKTGQTVESGRYVTRWKKQKDGAWKLYLDMNVPLDN